MLLHSDRVERIKTELPQLPKTPGTLDFSHVSSLSTFISRENRPAGAVIFSASNPLTGLASTRRQCYLRTVASEFLTEECSSDVTSAANYSRSISCLLSKLRGSTAVPQGRAQGHGSLSQRGSPETGTALRPCLTSAEQGRTAPLHLAGNIRMLHITEPSRLLAFATEAHCGLLVTYLSTGAESHPLPAASLC